MKKLLSIFACFVFLFAAGVTLTACDDGNEDEDADATVVSTVTEFYEALNNQEDGLKIVLNAGTYDLDPAQLTSSVVVDGYEYTNWYLLITEDNVTIKGKGDVTLTSSHETANGNWNTQNFITVVGDNFTLQNVKVVSKKETNKAIEVLGKNLTLKDVTFNAPADYKFAGSVYFNNVMKKVAGTETYESTGGDMNVGTVTFENVTLNKGRITASGATTGKFVFKTVNIDWTDIEADVLDLYPLYNLTTATNTEADFDFEGLSTVKIKIDAQEFGSFDNVAAAQAEMPEGVVVEILHQAA